MIELGGMRTQTGLDVAQAFPVSELREGHAQELVEMREGKRMKVIFSLFISRLNQAAPEISGQ